MDRQKPTDAQYTLFERLDPGLLLAGAVVQRADIAEHGAVLKVRSPGETAYLVLVGGPRSGAEAAAAGAQGVALARGKVAKPAGANAMKRLEGYRVVFVTPAEVALVRGEARAWIAVRGGRIVVEGAAEARAGADAKAEAGADAKAEAGADAEAEALARNAARAEEREAWLARGEAMIARAVEGALEARRAAAVRAVKRGIARLERRIAAVRGDIARIGDAEALASRAQWLIAEAARAPRGAKSLSVTDWSTGEARVLEVPLDPAKPARDQVQAMFQRARRLKLGAKIAEERLGHATHARDALAAIATDVASAPDMAAIDASIARARTAAPKDVTLEEQSASGRRTPQGKSPPYRTFHARSGDRILVGRGAAQNDVLTFQAARPHDLWLHAKDRAGAHVIAPQQKGHACPPELLVDAAHLAAHFSEARDEAVVDVQYVERRHLRKPRGSAPGLVVVDREKVIALRRDERILRALLDSEEA